MQVKLVNITNVIDCLDHERSELEMMFGEIIGAIKLHFRPEKLVDKMIFKIPEFSQTRFFVTDKFKDLVENSKLKGYRFEKVCDLDVTVEQEREWQQQYEEIQAAIEVYAGPTVEWAEAIRKVKDGLSMASGTWKLQADATGIMLIGSLVGGGKYSWNDPIYIPPVLLSLQWHEVERTEM